MRKVLNKVTLVMMTLVATFLLVACGNGGNNNIQGTWISEGMPVTSELIAGDGDTGADVVVELFVNEENEFDMTATMTVPGVFSSSEEEVFSVTGKVENGKLVAEGGAGEIPYKRSDTKLTITFEGEEIVFKKQIKED